MARAGGRARRAPGTIGGPEGSGGRLGRGEAEPGSHGARMPPEPEIPGRGGRRGD